MASSSSDSLEFQEQRYVPITERPEWADVAPLRPPPASHEVVAIRSDADHADLLAVFWAALTAGELSPRVLDLTEEIILNFNSAHFSVWEWRWRCLLALGALSTPEGLAAEALLLRRVATDNPKNYQLWNHRRKFALARGAGHVGEEMEFAAACLSFDAKNYHAWAHRQAVIAAFGGGEAAAVASSGAAAASVEALWGEELAYTERMLRNDLRNNSAWNQRFYVLKNAPNGRLGDENEIYQRELDFARVKISLAPHNEAAWSYLRAVVTLGPGAPTAALGFENAVRDVCMETLKKDSSNAPALLLLADWYAGRATVLCGGSSAAETVMGRREKARAAAVEAARELLTRLGVADPARAAYSEYRLSALLDGEAMR